MNLKQSLLLFGLPGVTTFLGMTYALQPLLAHGIPMFWAVFFWVWLPLVLVLVFVIIRWRTSRQSLAEFFWVKKLSGRVVLFCLLVFVLVQVAEVLLSPTRELLAVLPGFEPPALFPPLFLPNFEPTIPLAELMGLKTAGNYALLGYWGLWLIVNIIGEEVVWRGYALPRMEKHFGKWAWLINGILWNIVFHFFMRWSVLAILPTSFVIPYLCQRYQSMWPGVIIHGLGNSLFYIILFPSVFQ